MPKRRTVEQCFGKRHQRAMAIVRGERPVVAQGVRGPYVATGKDAQDARTAIEERVRQDVAQRQRDVAWREEKKRTRYW